MCVSKRNNLFSFFFTDIRRNLIPLIFLFTCLNAYRYDRTSTNGRIYKKLLPTDVTYKTWNLYVNIDLKLFDDNADILSAILNDLNRYCQKPCNELVEENIKKILDMTIHSNIGRLWSSHQDKENNFDLTNNRTIDYNSTISENQTNYIEKSQNLFSRLKEIHEQMKLIKSFSVSLIDFTDISSSLEIACKELIDTHRYLEEIVTRPEELNIDDIIPYELFENEFDKLHKTNNHDQLPFGLNKYNSIQYTKISTDVVNDSLTIRISIPIIHDSIGKGFVYEILPIPIRTSKGTFIIRNDTPYAIISDSITPLFADEFGKCKATPSINICSPSSATYKENYCELDIFQNKSKEEIFQSCHLERIKSKNYIVRIDPMTYYFYIDSSILFREECPGLPPLEDTLISDGIFTIENDCKIIGKDFELNTEQNQSDLFFDLKQIKKEINFDSNNTNMILNSLTNATDEQPHIETINVPKKAIRSKYKLMHILITLFAIFYVFLCISLFIGIRCHNYYKHLSTSPDDDLRMETLV